MFVVPVTVTSHVNGTQCLHLRIPSDRIVENPIQHMYAVDIIVQAALKLPILFVMRGLTQEGEFRSIFRDVNVHDLADLEVSWIAQDFQLLCE